MGRKRTESRQIIRRVASFSDFKDKIAELNLTMQVEETEKYYLLKAIDGRKLWVHTVWKSAYLASHTVAGVNVSQEASDQTDFEANHKTAAESDPTTNEATLDGKMLVHNTPTPVGATTYFACVGDDPADKASVGGGVKMVIDHQTAGGDNALDVHFNMAQNKTYIHSGYLIWSGAQQDCITMYVMAYASTSQAGASTNYTTFNYPGHPWHGKLIIPASGDGDLDVTAVVLVGFYPSVTKQLGDMPPRYWNATWNPATKVYDSITAAPAGDGEFNMFTEEMYLFCFARSIILEGDNYTPWPFQSHDSQRLGDGMFVRIAPDTEGTDHNWRAIATIIMHRESTL